MSGTPSLFGNGNGHELPPNANPDIKRVLVGIPLKGHTPPESYHDRIKMAYYMGGVEIQQERDKIVPRYQFIVVSMGEIFIPYAREMLADQALKNECDYLFMVDDDMMAPEDLFYRLVCHDVDIVAPLAFTRNAPHRPVMFSVIEGFDSVMRRNYFMGTTVNNYPRNKLVECDAVGFGAVLIKTEIFRRMAKPYFMGSMNCGEDMHFCAAAKKLGYRVFMDTSTKLGHLSHPVIVTEEYVDNFHKLSQEQKDKVYGFYTKYSENGQEKAPCPS
jgi:hypothetical protein